MKCPLRRTGATYFTAKLGAKPQFKQTHHRTRLFTFPGIVFVLSKDFEKLNFG